MKLCLCGAMQDIDAIEAAGAALRHAGHAVFLPSRGDANHVPQIADKAWFVAEHLDKIQRADAVLLTNFDRAGTRGYVGRSGLMEAAMAYALGKPIFILNAVGDLDVAAELRALGGIVLDGRLDGLKQS